MLELQGIRKSYKIGEIVTDALKGVSIAFREKEFVAILGASGSGKTTLLNIIGGLDRYDSGDFIIKGKNTKNFSNKDWDAYRNNSIGFVFQSYNLITHINIIKNVELALTLTGIPADVRHQKAIDVLTRVGLKEHLHKKPSQLSGGQMQRVAIARALINDPEILLCDEPTGALDSVTSKQILDLIKEVSNERLVIMVTHNSEMASLYANRIIKLADGEVTEDSNPARKSNAADTFTMNKTRMTFWNALGLSFTNILTKKGRTFLTSFASSIGIIGIGLVLSLSAGFQEQVNIYEKDTLAGFPIIVSSTSARIDPETLQEQQSDMQAQLTGDGEYPDTSSIEIRSDEDNSIVHRNYLIPRYIRYVENIDPEICDMIGIMRTVHFNLVANWNGNYIPATLGNTRMGSSMINLIHSYPSEDGVSKLLEEGYDVLAGDAPASANEFVLVVDHRNRIDADDLKVLAFDSASVTSLDFDDIVGTEYKLISNDDWYLRMENGVFAQNEDYQAMWDSPNSVTLTLSAIVRQKPDNGMSILATGIVYSDELAEETISRNLQSEIVKRQKMVNFSVLTGQSIGEMTRETQLKYFGGDDEPTMITLYPADFEDKDKVLDYLNAYNTGLSDDKMVIYTDMAGTISELSGGIMSAVTYVLVGFSSVSLFVSLIMVAIIIYTSVLERRKEIGILKALGARNKDITRVFNAETFIIGAFSGALGLAIAWALTFPISMLIYELTELENVAKLLPVQALMLFAVNLVLTLLAGWIPAKMAARQDPVVALRSE